MLRRLPIRLRLTLLFAGVMAVVLATAGLALHVSLERSLDGQLNSALSSRLADVQALVSQADQGLSQAGQSAITEKGENFAQVLSASGGIYDASPLLRRRPLLRPVELRAALSDTVTISRRQVPGIEDAARLMAAPFRAQDQRLVAIVGASLAERDDTLGNLTLLLLIGGPLALLIASLAGYGLATAAFRPVEAMRHRAALISGTEEGARLPLSPAQDELRMLGETLNAMLARIDMAMARERTFVSDASHELRTPLAILKGEIEVALHRNRTPEELRAALRSAGEETDRLVQLAEDLLVITRSDQGRLPVRQADLHVAEVLSSVRDRFARRAAEGGRTLGVEAAPDLVVFADELRVEQALGNLVDNALRYGSGPVDLRALRRNGSVEIHVQDAGCGFPQAFIPTAFERFTRADPARGRGGAGLGLAIVRAIARAHGGEAHVANVDGTGADAWIVLPSSGVQ